MSVWKKVASSKYFVFLGLNLIGVAWLSTCAETTRAQLVDHVLHISVDGLHAGQLQTAITTMPDEYPNFARLAAEGVSTLNARIDVTNPFTLPNHTSMITGRPVSAPGDDPTLHHGHLDNGTPGPARTLHMGNPDVDYIASTFDIAHDYGLSTALYTTKSKFVLYEQSYNATEMTPGGRADVYLENGDQGTNKIDKYTYRIVENSSIGIVQAFIEDTATTPANYAFIHMYEPDEMGHIAGWRSERYNQVLKTVDSELGMILDLVDNDANLQGNSAIILTSDHGGSLYGHDNTMDMNIYQVPFFVWALLLPPGQDLYALNPLTRTDPGTAQVPYTAERQPIRNSDSANLAMSLLGLPSVDGSTINNRQDLRVELPVQTTWTGANGNQGSAGDGVSWTDARNWTRHSADQSPIAGDTIVLPANSTPTIVNLQDDRQLHALEVAGDYRTEGGSLELLTGEVNVAAGGSLTVAGSLITPRSIIKSGGGTLSIVNGADNAIASDTLVSEGRLEGEFRVAGQLASAGTLAPGAGQSIGTITVSDDYTQNGAGTFEVQLSAENSDRIVVRDYLIYRGQLDLQTLGDDVLPTEPTELRTWQLTESGRRIGKFARIRMDGQAWELLENSFDIQLAHLGGGRFGQLHYSGESLMLTLYQTVPGDVDGDGAFNTKDLVILFAGGGYENGVSGDADWLSGDWNGDTDFTSRDLVVALSISGFEQPSFLPSIEGDSAAAVANVPEPTSLSLLVFGIAGIIMSSTRRSHRACRSA